MSTTPGPPPSRMPERRAVTIISVALVISMLGALGLAVVYWRGGNPQAEGAFLFVALGALGLALVTWARHLQPIGPDVQDRGTIATSEEAQEAVGEAFDREDLIARRHLLHRLLGATIGAFGLAALFPIRSLGPDPGDALYRTPWEGGRRMVNQDGQPVLAREVPLDGLVTGFPEGYVGSADGQAILVRVDPQGLHLPPDRADWAPEGLIAYSKVCTHAGCPVGLYQAATHQVLCPCHQSNFDVLDLGRPVEGPAARRLPQLPLEIDAEGYVRARGDFSEPVGPAWWGHP